MQLKHLLMLYARHRRKLYLNYYEDFKLLVNWLGCELPSLPVAELGQVNWYEANYEVQELAKILKCPQSLVLQLLKDNNDG